MKTAKEYREEAAKFIEKAGAIQSGAEAEGKDLTDEQVEAIANHLAEAKEHQAEADKLDKRASVAAELDKAKADLNKPAGRKVEGNVNEPQGSSYDMGDAHLATGDAPVDKDPKMGFAHYGDFCNDVRAACAQMPAVSDRLLKSQAAYGQNTASGDEGGFLIPPDFSTKMFERVMTGDELPILSQCDKLLLKGNSVTVNGLVDHNKNGTTYRYGGVVVYWVSEAGQITRSTLKFRKIDLKLHKMAAMSFLTDEEEQDAIINFGQRLLSKHSEAINDTLENALMFGTGVGQPLGAFNANNPSLISVDIEDGQAADDIDTQNIVKMYSRIHTKSKARGAWYYEGSCFPQLMTLTLDVGTGGVAVFMPPNGLSQSPYGTMLGRTMYETEHCQELGDAGDIVFGDFSQYLLAMKGTIKNAMSVHLRFDYDEIAYKTTFRVDGRPAWDRAYTKRNDTTNTQSPFVQIVERA